MNAGDFPSPLLSATATSSQDPFSIEDETTWANQNGSCVHAEVYIYFERELLRAQVYVTEEYSIRERFSKGYRAGQLVLPIHAPPYDIMHFPSKPPDLTQVYNQLGSAVVNLKTGKLEKSTGEMSGERGEKASRTITDMLPSIAKILEKDALRRVTITLTMCQFVLSIYKGNLYILKKKLDVL